MTRIIYNLIGSRQGADYSSVSAWEASIQGYTPDEFYVGIVSDNLSLGSQSKPPHLKDPLRDLRHSPTDGFLLIHSTGDIIASQLNGKLAVDEAAVFFDSSNTDWDNKAGGQAIHNFLRSNAIEVSAQDHLKYADDDFDDKIKIIIPSLEIIDAQLIAYLAKHPGALHELNPRKFEELLDELFKDQGFESHLGPGQNDGGVDLRLIQRSDVGQLLFLVQAKRHAAHLKIRLDPVKALYASVEEEKANKGIFVSTAEFLPGTRDYANRNHYRIELVGPDELLDWLRKYGRR